MLTEWVEGQYFFTRSCVLLRSETEYNSQAVDFYNLQAEGQTFICYLQTVKTGEPFTESHV